MKNSIFSLLVLLISFFAHSEGFVAGTLVKTPTGYTAIQNIKIGDLVLSCDFEDNCVERSVLATHQEEADSYVEVSVSGQAIGVGATHLFYTPHSNSWIEASRLNPSVVLMNANYEDIAIQAVRVLAEPVTLFNISVDKHHNFYVSESDVLVHNQWMGIRHNIGGGHGGGYGGGGYGGRAGGDDVRGIRAARNRMDQENQRREYERRRRSTGYVPPPPEPLPAPYVDPQEEQRKTKMAIEQFINRHQTHCKGELKASPNGISCSGGWESTGEINLPPGTMLHIDTDGSTDRGFDYGTPIWKIRSPPQSSDRMSDYTQKSVELHTDATSKGDQKGMAQANAMMDALERAEGKLDENIRIDPAKKAEYETRVKQRYVTRAKRIYDYANGSNPSNSTPNLPSGYESELGIETVVVDDAVTAEAANAIDQLMAIAIWKERTSPGRVLGGFGISQAISQARQGFFDSAYRFMDITWHVIDIGVGLIPVVGDLRDACEAITGWGSCIRGNGSSTPDRLFAAAGALFGSKNTWKYTAKTVGKGIENATGAVKDITEAVARLTTRHNLPSEVAQAMARTGWILPDEVFRKIPKELVGDPRLNRKLDADKIGLRWLDLKTDGKKYNIRIDKGDPKSEWPSQRVDHVRITCNGKVIGRDGLEIKKRASIPYPSNTPEAHIPLDEWLTWKSWNER